MDGNQYLRVSGRNKLIGDIHISGSKNSVSALIPALCIGQGVGKIKNAPEVTDVEIMKGILNELGLLIESNNNEIIISGDLKYNKLSPTYVSKIRASSLFLGVLLSRFGKAQVPFSGGDRIGDRPLDIHFYVFNKYGITTEFKDGYICCEATQFPYKGQTVFLRYPSVGATENALLIAALADSPSIIYNAAMEPEIVDMAIMLNRMGALITGAGTPVLRIKPATTLSRVEHEAIPDRLEAGTFLFCYAATRGKGTIYNVIPEHLISVISLLADCGAKIDICQRSISIDATASSKYLGINVNAMPYPGIPTDLQPFAAVFASTCCENSLIMDSVHRERFAYLYELRRMGLLFDHKYDQATIKGEQQLAGTEVEGNDIRMTAALILGSLIASGESKILGLQHLFRGYDDFINKLKLLGANVEVLGGN